MKRKAVIVDGRGNLRVDEIPLPELLPNRVLFSNHFSLISSGTETSVILKRRADKNSNQDDFCLGYSSAGVVEEVARECKRIKAGDRIASMGWGISVHSNINAAPEPLVAKIPEKVEFQEATFTTLAIVAMNAVRISNIGLGETAVIIGQGLVGQLTAQIARIAGARIVSTDFLDVRLKLSKDLGADLVLNAKKKDIEKSTLEYTEGRGADVVFICTGGDNTKVFDQAARIARDRAKIIIIGRTTNLCFNDQLMYQKELTIIMARGYGPGYHDPEYEEKGHDYPLGYVRWTANRNMNEVLRLMAEGVLKVKPLITHEFRLDDAVKAYQIIMETPSSVMGVLLSY
jgi:threonine dehydrogenase-like Zn-dependent dehydrogenase